MRMAFRRSSVAVALCILVYGGATADVVSAIPWPEHGVVRVGVEDSPSELIMDLPGCLSVSVDWANSRVTAKGVGAAAEVAMIESGPKMRPSGGKFVGLMMLEEKQMHVVVNTEMEGGTIDSQTLRLPMAKACPLEKMKVSSPNGKEGLNVRVSVSKEIEDLIQPAAST